MYERTVPGQASAGLLGCQRVWSSQESGVGPQCSCSPCFLILVMVILSMSLLHLALNVDPP